MVVQLDVDLPRFYSRLAAKYRRMHGGIDQGLQELAEEVRDAAKDLAPVRSGKYRDGITVRRLGSLHYAVQAEAPHSRHVEEGRGEVHPVNAEVLRWETPEGEVVFARMAGPAEGHHVLARAREEAGGRARSIVGRNLAEALARDAFMGTFGKAGDFLP